MARLVPGVQAAINALYPDGTLQFSPGVSGWFPRIEKEGKKMAYEVSFRSYWNDGDKTKYEFETLEEALIEFLGHVTDNETITLKFKANKEK